MNMKQPVANSLQRVARKIRLAFSLPTAGYGLQAQRGFTLLLAALIASIVLSLGSSIFMIAKKQITLSSLGRDSQFAFYAADTGAECALYWDVRYNAFATTTVAATPTCDGKELAVTGIEEAPPYVAHFQINLFTDASGGYCTDVMI